MTYTESKLGEARAEVNRLFDACSERGINESKLELFIKRPELITVLRDWLNDYGKAIYRLRQAETDELERLQNDKKEAAIKAHFAEVTP